MARKINHAAGAPLPGKNIWRTPVKKDADAAAKRLTDAGAKAAVVIVPTGADIERGWGARVSVAQDYLYDQPLMLGSRRIGPDLANIGARKPGADWQLWHLYNPRLITDGSFMPAYRFLFNEVPRRKDAPPALGALDKTLVAKTFPEPAGETVTDIVPTAEAVALVAYLASLNPDAPLFEAPAPVPPPPAAPATNTPAAVKP
ncbi:MAG: cbb3-type cytochrome c oxidase subunit II [Verrucomicrobia bacterium]|nr:cbb3-type cytochrome c oxidase subunit II [Verrucomicrobiota bacterium]